MPRKRLHQQDKKIKYVTGKVKSKTNQSIKSTEVDSRIDDSPCIDEHYENEYNPVASVTTPDVTILLHRSHRILIVHTIMDYQLLSVFEVKKDISIKIKQRQSLPLIYNANYPNWVHSSSKQLFSMMHSILNIFRNFSITPDSRFQKICYFTVK